MMTSMLPLRAGATMRQCETCQQFFVQYHPRGEQRHCPTCADTLQRRPSRVVERELLARVEGVKIVSLPFVEWTLFQSGEESDFPVYKMDAPGSILGGTWEGRIVLYAPRPWQAGDWVSVRDMLARHEVRASYRVRPTSGFTQLDGGPTSVTLRTVYPLAAELPDSRVEVEERPYVVLEPYSGQPTDRELVWLTATEKYTLKGLGAQYRYSLHGAPLWQKRVGGGVRNRRRWTTGALAVVDSEHPLTVTQDYYVTGSGVPL